MYVYYKYVNKNNTCIILCKLNIFESFTKIDIYLTSFI